MLTRFTKNILQNSKHKKILKPSLAKLFSSNEEDEKITFEKRWKLKKFSEEEIKEYHKKIFEALNFEKSNPEDQNSPHLIYTEKSRPISELIYSGFYYILPLPLILIILAGLYTFFIENDNHKKFDEEDYEKTLKIAKLTDYLNFTEDKNYDDLLKALTFLDNLNKKYGYPDLKHSGMYKDQEIKSQLLRLIMKDLPESLSKDEKIDVLMAYDQAILKKFYYQDLAINFIYGFFAMSLTFTFSFYNLTKRRVKKISVDFLKREIDFIYSSLNKRRGLTMKFDDFSVEGIGNNQLRVSQDMILRINSGAKERDEHLYEYLLLLSDQKDII